MAAFRFRLASVLRYRERYREERRLEFVREAKERKQLTDEIRRLEQLLSSQIEGMADEGGQCVTGADLQLRGEFILHTTQRIQEYRTLLVTVEQRLEEKRLVLLHADREVKSLEQLKARRREQHRRQENAKEQRSADEVGQRRYLDQKRLT